MIVSFHFVFLTDNSGQEYIAIDANNDEEFTNDEINVCQCESYKINDMEIEVLKTSAETMVDLFINGKKESMKIPVGISKSWIKGTDKNSNCFFNS